MVALACYFDESFDEQIHVVAGYLAPIEVWDDFFAPAWNDVLRSAPYPISEFKSADCMSGGGEFKKPWTKWQRRKLRADLVSVMTRMPIYAGVSAAFFWPGKGDPRCSNPSDNVDRMLKIGYGIAVGLCLRNAFGLAGALSDTETVQPVFDRRKKFWHKVLLNFNAVRKQVGPELSTKLKSPVEESEPLPALQAADLFAHETYKEIIRRCEKKRPRQALQRMLAWKTPYLAQCVVMPPLEIWNVLREHNFMRAYGYGPKDFAYLYNLFVPGKPMRAVGNWRCRKQKSLYVPRALRERVL